MSTVTNLTAIHRDGQTFLTFAEIAGVGVTYDVYRETSEITSLSGLTPIATLDQDSGRLLHDDSATVDLNAGFVIEDEGTPLTSGTGLLVWTTATNGTYFYAVTNSTDAALSAGNNSLTSGVTETNQETPGWVLLSGPTLVSGRDRYQFFCWEDYSTWDDTWGYYGHRVDVLVKPSLTPATLYPLWLYLHPADGTGYYDPTSWNDYVPPSGALNTSTIDGVYIMPRDPTFSDPVDPYTGASRNGTYDIGNYRASNDRVALNTNDRHRRYLKLARDTAAFQVDPNRMYVMGASRGGGSSALFAYRNPDLITAASVTIPWIDTTQGDLSFAPMANELMDDGEAFNNIASLPWNVANQDTPPPVMYYHGSNDNILSNAKVPDLIAALQARKVAHTVVWAATGHGGGYLNETTYPQANVARFKKNEAYPCFTSGSQDDTATNVAGDIEPAAGQVNRYLDWQSSLHTITGGSAITDEDHTFGVSLISLNASATADVTIRNQQTFTNMPGADVEWDDGTSSGTVQVSADGSITIPGVTIGTSAMRLTLTLPVHPGISGRVSLRGVRI